MAWSSKGGKFFVSLKTQLDTYYAGLLSNGRSGEVLVTKHEPKNVPPDHRSCRLVRAKLQAALLKEVDRKRVHVGKRLIAIDHLPNDRIRLTFQCGYIADVDLLVAADGSRSVRRPQCAMNCNPVTDPECRLSAP